MQNWVFVFKQGDVFVLHQIGCKIVGKLKRVCSHKEKLYQLQWYNTIGF